MDKEKLIRLLRHHEGVRLKPYFDSMGVLSIGVGRNLQSVGILESEASQMLENDIKRVMMQIPVSFRWYDTLSDIRKIVLISMVFQLGMSGVMRFTKFLGAMGRGEYDKASEEMLDSVWFKQAPVRVRELSFMMLRDEWPKGLKVVVGE